MIRTRNAPTAAFNPMKEVKAAAAAEEWEVRPGGMLVQKRAPDSESAVAAAAAAVPTIRVKVKYESAYYEIYLSSQSTFGELKKLMGERTGLHPQEQKILYKDRERESGAYLDVCGVRDRSKLVLLVDPAAHARRLLDARRAAKSEKAALAVKNITSQVAALGLQVSDMETMISKSKKVPDKDILNLIEQLMTQLIKLDGVVAEGRRPEATKRNAGEESAKVCGDTRCAQDQECQDRDHAAAAATTSEATAAAATVTGEIGRNCNCGGRVDVDGDWCSFGWLLGL